MLVPIVQSITGQLQKNYGKEGAEILTDNCQDTIFRRLRASEPDSRRCCPRPWQPHRDEWFHLPGEERYQPEPPDD